MYRITTNFGEEVNLANRHETAEFKFRQYYLYHVTRDIAVKAFVGLASLVRQNYPSEHPAHSF